ncbi:MAG: hypothetical protein WBO54_12355 [Thermoanaerobaculia bacterium]
MTLIGVSIRGPSAAAMISLGDRVRAGQILDLPLRIWISVSTPEVRCRVQRRECWFCVDGTDIESRLFLELVVTL